MSACTAEEAIEACAIKDTQQFYTFRGAEYKLREPVWRSAVDEQLWWGSLSMQNLLCCWKKLMRKRIRS